MRKNRLTGLLVDVPFTKSPDLYRSDRTYHSIDPLTRLTEKISTSDHRQQNSA